MTFAKQIKEAREGAGLTQRTAALMFAVDLRTYQYWEAGEHRPASKLIRAMILEKLRAWR